MLLIWYETLLWGRDTLDINDMLDIDINDISAHFFATCYFFSFHLPKRFKRNMNEELHQAMETSSNIAVENDHIFKKHLDVGYPRNFIYSVFSAWWHIPTLGLKLY